MNVLKVYNHRPQIFHTSQTVPHLSLSLSFNFPFKKSTPLSPSSSSFAVILPLSIIRPIFKTSTVARIEAPLFYNNNEEEERNGGVNSTELEDLAPDSVVYQNTLRLVECSMFAAVTGLVYFLSNSLSIENYFGCFFSLPIVISSLRWGVAAGRKTVIATAMVLIVLSGPVKALTYLLTHGLFGFTMGSLWRMGANWGLSVFLCTIAKATGAMGYVFLSSFLIRENILALITINVHASLTFIFAAAGINTVPSMNVIYTLFGILVVLNSGFFVFLLHLLYSVFLTRLGMKDSLRLPRWLEKALKRTRLLRRRMWHLLFWLLYPCYEARVFGFKGHIEAVYILQMRWGWL